MRAVLFVILVAACGGGQQGAPPPAVSNVARPAPVDAAVDAPTTGMAAVLARLDQFAEAMCRCPDKACAERQAEELTKWGTEMSKVDHASEKMTEADTKHAEATTRRMTDCMAKALAPASGSNAHP